MSWPAVTVPPWFSAGDALRYAEMMRVHRLPVAKAGVVVGAVCTCQLAEHPAATPLVAVMSAPATIDRQSPMHEALERMVSERVDWLCVDGLDAPGLITLGDLERAGMPIDADLAAELRCASKAPPSHVRAIV